jgi:hypothetical protein
VLAGCNLQDEGNEYKLVAAATGDVYRINESSGAIHKIQGGVLTPIVETDRIQLKVGSVYVFEDGNQMEYLGGGKFKPFKSEVMTLDEYLKTERGKK